MNDLLATVSAREMRELDRRAHEEFGIPGLILMENAGRAVAEAAMSNTQDRLARIAILCGSGNNGGDGMVAARYLWNQGRFVSVFLIKDPVAFHGDALVNWHIVEKLGIPAKPFGPSVTLDDFSLVIDALLGTGLNSNVSGIYAEAIDRMNASGIPVIAVDIPSGLDADTGIPRGSAVKAEVTVTMAFPKTGMNNDSAAPFVGKMIVADIGFPRQLVIRRIQAGDSD